MNQRFYFICFCKTAAPILNTIFTNKKNVLYNLAVSIVKPKTLSDNSVCLKYSANDHTLLSSTPFLIDSKTLELNFLYLSFK